MAFTYTLPITVDRDRVRLRIGDTDSTAPAQQRLEDEEIASFLTDFGSVSGAMPECAEALAAKFARLSSEKSAGSLTIRYAAGRYTTLMDLAKRLRMKASSAAIPYSPAISVADKQSNEEDTDKVQPVFRRGMHDNPLAPVATEGTRNQENIS